MAPPPPFPKNSVVAARAWLEDETNHDFSPWVDSQGSNAAAWHGLEQLLNDVTGLAPARIIRIVKDACDQVFPREANLLRRHARIAQISQVVTAVQPIIQNESKVGWHNDMGEWLQQALNTYVKRPLFLWKKNITNARSSELGKADRPPSSRSRHPASAKRSTESGNDDRPAPSNSRPTRSEKRKHSHHKTPSPELLRPNKYAIPPAERNGAMPGSKLASTKAESTLMDFNIEVLMYKQLHSGEDTIESMTIATSMLVTDDNLHKPSPLLQLGDLDFEKFIAQVCNGNPEFDWVTNGKGLWSEKAVEIKDNDDFQVSIGSQYYENKYCDKSIVFWVGRPERRTRTGSEMEEGQDAARVIESQDVDMEDSPFRY